MREQKNVYPVHFRQTEDACQNGGSGCQLSLRNALRYCVTCGLLMILLLAAQPVGAQADGPTGDAPAPPSEQERVQYLDYLQQMVDRWSAGPPVAIPESTMGTHEDAYVHNWDENDVAYIPESTMTKPVEVYVPNWDENDVAYIPESTMTIPLEELFGAEYARVDQ